MRFSLRWDDTGNEIMAKIEGFRVQNFKSLRDVTVGRLSHQPQNEPLTPMTAVIGKNGVGKSALFDAFGFLADALKFGVEEACDVRGRGGFERLRTQGQAGPIGFEVYYREHFKDAEFIRLEDPRKLGIATLGVLKQHPRIVAFRRFIEGWYLSYFTPDAARSLPLAGPQQRLNVHGDNLGNVVQFMEREHPERFQSILKEIAERIPGIDKIATERTADGRLLLKFNDKGFQDPFYVQQMSDGTLKVFAYLLLLNDPTPPPFLCIEEPENGLYHKLLETLVHEFREHAIRKNNGSQIFITAHQPYLVDALDPKEVWILEKGADGFSMIRRASDDPIVNNMVAEGLPLGGLWYSDYLDKR